MAKRAEIVLCVVALIICVVVALAVPADYLVEGFQNATGIRLPTKEAYGLAAVLVEGAPWIAGVGLGLRLIWRVTAGRRGA